MSDIIDELSQAAAAYAKALKAIQFKVNPTKNELAEIEKCKSLLKQAKRSFSEATKSKEGQD